MKKPGLAKAPVGVACRASGSRHEPRADEAGGASEQHPEDQADDRRHDDEVMGKPCGTALSKLAGFGAPTRCGTTISAIASTASGNARVNASSANPAAVAPTVATHQTCLAASSAAGIPGSSGGRPSPGARVKTEKPASPQKTPCRQPVIPPANSDAVTRRTANPMAVTMLASAVKAERWKPSAGAHASSSCSCECAAVASPPVCDRRPRDREARLAKAPPSRRSPPAGSAERCRHIASPSWRGRQ